MAFAPTTPPPITTTFAGGTPGTPPRRMPAPPCARSRQCAPALDRRSASNLRHRRQQRQTAVTVGHGLVGNTRRSAGDEIPALLRIGRQVQVGEQDLSVAQHPALARLRFLHLDNHLGPVEHRLRVADDLGTRRPVVFVGAADSGARLGFDDNLVALDGELTDAIGGQPDPILENLDLAGNPDDHRLPRLVLLPLIFRSCT